MPETSAGTVLAFDYGGRRVGVAVGEAGLGTAHPLPGIDAAGTTRFEAIGRLVAEWRPTHLVVGLPLAADGTEHDLSARARRFARQLAGRFQLPVELVDERYSSVAAATLLRGTRSGKLALDSVAAQLVLEQHFHERIA